MKRKIRFIAIVLLTFSCRDKITIENIVDNHRHTHTDLGTPGFPEMPIPVDNETTEEGIALGRKLFYDPILSGNETQSCATCHQQSRAFSDNKRFSVGIDGIAGKLNASAIINPGWQSSAFWNGRANSLEEQAVEPVENPIELHLNWEDAVDRLKRHDDYPGEFQIAFGTTHITKDLVTKALAQFERSLISNQSKFDKFLNGEIELTPLELAGYNLFLSEKAECFHCHVRPLFTDDELHNNGLDINPDKGHFEVSSYVYDKGKFRTPTLRNIEFTAPYMHDGRFETLEDVIDFYSDSIKTSITVDPLMPNDNGGFHWTELEKLQLISFLKTLSDTSFINNPDFSNPFVE
ncbi:MAG: cytochrome-c peroxidase [Flavobacteriales bacterium]|nr:cytochrome-c peroxidase [Flavobacteriales bacterium]|tara:strand:+ start:2758 stop:3804 length:1047 start_codon:yes stop_codon:yes gene_type:complete